MITLSKLSIDDMELLAFRMRKRSLFIAPSLPNHRNLARRYVKIALRIERKINERVNS
jgi:hypothetical protein